MREFKFLLPALACCAIMSSAVGAPSPAVSTGPVKCGEWNSDFAAVQAVAQKEALPMIVVVASRKCPYCIRLNNVIFSDSFNEWLAGKSLYLAYEVIDEESIKVSKAYAFLSSVVDAQIKKFPYVGVQWIGRDGKEEIKTAFLGRRGKMPVHSEHALSDGFIRSLEAVLAKYLMGKATDIAKDGGKSSVRCRHVQVKIEGAPGKVLMTPESGEVFEDSRVKVEVADSTNMVFLGWTGPDGTYLGNKPCRFVNYYAAGNGPLTARFRSRGDIMPPTLISPVTSVYAYVGIPFRQKLEIDPRCRPVRLSAGKMPYGFGFFKAGESIGGLARHTGTNVVEVVAEGSDPANTRTVWPIRVIVNPKDKFKAAVPVLLDASAEPEDAP